MLTRSAAPVAFVKDRVLCLSMPSRHTGALNLVASEVR
jgi:hypothetical protein